MGANTKPRGRRPDHDRDKELYKRYRDPATVVTHLLEELAKDDATKLSHSGFYKLVKRVEARFPELVASMDDKYPAVHTS